MSGMTRSAQAPAPDPEVIPSNQRLSFAASRTRDSIRRSSLRPSVPPVPNPAPDGESAGKISQAIVYMQEHLDKQLQVAKLAAVVNVSPSHFFALFKRQTGRPPIDFFIRLRMQHACALLDGTRLNIKEVAALLGYDDPFYFSRTFKSVHRVAPSEYRALDSEAKAAVKETSRRSTFTSVPDFNGTQRPASSNLNGAPAAGSGSAPSREPASQPNGPNATSRPRNSREILK